jgi:hypothetical protein
VLGNVSACLACGDAVEGDVPWSPAFTLGFLLGDGYQQVERESCDILDRPNAAELTQS